MAVARYADRFKCDCCGAEADGKGPADPTDPWPSAAAPEGWTAATVATPAAPAVTAAHVCETCSALPWSHVLGQLAAR